MFTQTTELIFSTISGTIKDQKKALHLKRVDIMPDNEPLISNITNNHRNLKYPNLMSNANALVIAKKLNFESVNQMLWGNINWDDIYKTAINEIYYYSGNELKMIELHNLLINSLTNNVHFAHLRAASSFETDILDEKQAKSIRDEALKEFHNRHIFDENQNLLIKPQLKLANNFINHFIETKLSKFSVRFPKFLQGFFTEILNELQPTENSIGLLAYYLSINAYNTFEEVSYAWFEQNKEKQAIYEQIQQELDKAVESMQNISNFEKQLFSNMDK